MGIATTIWFQQQVSMCTRIHRLCPTAPPLLSEKNFGPNSYMNKCSKCSYRGLTLSRAVFTCNTWQKGISFFQPTSTNDSFCTGYRTARTGMAALSTTQGNSSQNWLVFGLVTISAGCCWKLFLRCYQRCSWNWCHPRWPQQRHTQDKFKFGL